MPSHVQRAASRPALTSLQREQFLEAGMAHIPGLIPTSVIERMSTSLWDVLERRHGVRKGRPETWTREAPTHLQAFSRSGAFEDVAAPGFRAVLDELFGDRHWAGPGHWGQALVTAPAGRRPWSVPAVAWHLDLIDDRVLEPWPHWARLFILLAPLESGGGGTVYLAGSHRIVMRLMAEATSPEQRRCASLTQALKRESPWIAELCSPGGEPDRVRRFMEEGGTLRGVPLRVGEITGAAGDVFVMHPGLLHAAAPNVRAEPRLMVGTSIRRLESQPG